VGGQELTGENVVRALHASNIGGDVRFTNTLNLDILGIAQTGGDIEVANAESLTVRGAIEATADGNVTLDADRLVQNAGGVLESGSVDLRVVGSMDMKDRLPTAGNVTAAPVAVITLPGAGRTQGPAPLLTTCVDGLILTGENDVRTLQISNAGGDVRF